jgi:hypothetical protein
VLSVDGVGHPKPDQVAVFPGQHRVGGGVPPGDEDRRDRRDRQCEAHPEAALEAAQIAVLDRVVLAGVEDEGGVGGDPGDGEGFDGRHARPGGWDLDEHVGPVDLGVESSAFVDGRSAEVGERGWYLDGDPPVDPARRFPLASQQVGGTLDVLDGLCDHRLLRIVIGGL